MSNKIEIPWGCTHVQLANPLDYCQHPTFMKLDVWYYSENKPGAVNCWYIWRQHKFRRDLGYQKPKDESLFITVEEYRKTLQN